MTNFAALQPRGARLDDLTESQRVGPRPHLAVTRQPRSSDGSRPWTERPDVGVGLGHDFSRLRTRAEQAPAGARQPGDARSELAREAVPSRAAPPDTLTSGSRTESGKQRALGTGVGALGGAALGAGIGFRFGGPVGALVGGAIGAVAGGIVGYLASRRSVTVNVTRLTGAADTTAADLSTANTVFGQAGVSVSRGAEKSLSAADSTAVLGGDGVLDEYTGPAITAEETKLLAHNRTPGRITAYWVPSLSNGSRGEAMIPSYHGVAESSIVISSSARAADSFAHELGHCLLDDAAHHADPDNLMASGAIRNFADKLTEAQVRKMRASRYV